MPELPAGRSATWEVLVVGYTSSTGPGKPNAGTQATVSYIRDGDHHVVVDPGMVADRRLIIEPLARLGLSPDDVTEVVLSHHHPDNIMNVGLFPNAWVHDHKVVYRDAQWIDRDADGYSLTDSVKLMRTPVTAPRTSRCWPKQMAGSWRSSAISGGGPTGPSTTRLATWRGSRSVAGWS